MMGEARRSEMMKKSISIPTPSEKKVIIKNADMSEDLQKQVVACALSAVEKHSVEKEIAEYMKKEFDQKHGPTWHCIVGRSFENGDDEAHVVKSGFERSIAAPFLTIYGP